jgi:hypothetical protein
VEDCSSGVGWIGT